MVTVKFSNFSSDYPLLSRCLVAQYWTYFPDKPYLRLSLPWMSLIKLDCEPAISHLRSLFFITIRLCLLHWFDNSTIRNMEGKHAHLVDNTFGETHRSLFESHERQLQDLSRKVRTLFYLFLASIVFCSVVSICCVFVCCKTYSWRQELVGDSLEYQRTTSPGDRLEDHAPVTHGEQTLEYQVYLFIT